MSKNRKKRQTLFDPDKIATAIHQALGRDLSKAQHVYALDSSLTLYAFNRQVNELLKKFIPSDLDTTPLESATYDKFFAVNRHMADVNERLKSSLPHDIRQIQKSMPNDEKIHLRARALMHWVLGSFSVDEWFLECKHSGGSSLGVSYRDTSPEKKFTFPMTATKQAVRYFNHYTTYNAKLWQAVDLFNSQNPLEGPYSIEESSRATTVDKTSSIKRLICVEPTCNMYLQQGLMQMMYKRMKKVGLDVETLPEKHKTIARESSITGKYATIDWSSASDCGSRELYRWLLPPVWFDVADKIRCTSAMFNGEKVHLNMFSTMGNAVTFPLETLTFWTYAHAVRLTKNPNTNSLFPEWEELGECSVFGDDCIVPSTMAPDFIRTMEEVGFIINDEKSFYKTEQFRESCGGDYLVGYDVRPFHLKAPHTTAKSALEPWLYIIANALLKKYISYFGRTSYVYDKELFRLLFRLFRENKINIKLVPSYYPDDAGLKLSFDIQRFERHYRMKLSPIAVSKHGTCQFQYCSFRYWEQRHWDDRLRLEMWLQSPIQSKRRTPHVSNIRSRGGYVVAKGVSCHWHVPVVRPEA